MVSPPARRTLLHLRAHAALQRRLDVAEQQIRRVLIALGQLGIEIGEHVEIGGQRRRDRSCRREYTPAQKNVFPGHALQTFEIDAAAGQQIGIFLREIVAHHGDDARPA